MKPYYEHDGITIYHGDCREVMPGLEPVGLVVADPPYGMGKATWDVLMPPEEWLPQARRFPTVAVFCGVRGLHDYPRPDWTGAWVRVASTQRAGRFGGFNNWEPVLIYGGNKFDNDVFSVPNIQDKAAAGHPTTKPEKLLRLMVHRLSPSGTVLDPFMGSGTTLRAAKDLGRKAIGIEIEERYCEIAAKRLGQGALFA